MIGAEHHAPGVAGEQEQLEANHPLQRCDGGFVADTCTARSAARLHLDVHVHPLLAAAGVQQILDRPVGGDGARGAEHHLADVAAHLGMGVDVLDHLRGPPRPSSFRARRRSCGTGGG